VYGDKATNEEFSFKLFVLKGILNEVPVKEEMPLFIDVLTE
jgi:hypothetical protein